MTVEELNALKNSKQSNINKLIEEHAKLLGEYIKNLEYNIGNEYWIGGYGESTNGIINDEEKLKDIIKYWDGNGDIDNFYISYTDYYLYIRDIDEETNTIKYEVCGYSLDTYENLETEIDGGISRDPYDSFSITINGFDLSIIKTSDYTKKLVQYLEDTLDIEMWYRSFDNGIYIERYYDEFDVEDIINALKRTKKQYLREKDEKEKIESENRFTEIREVIKNFFEKSLDPISECIKESIENGSELNDSYSVKLTWKLYSTGIELLNDNHRISEEEFKYEIHSKNKNFDIYDNIKDKVNDIFIDVLEKAGYNKIKVKDSTIELSI